MNNLFMDNKYFLGCNYWASHAGIDMWKNWDEDVVRNDFKHLSEIGIKVLRVFPLWPDFQPIRMHLDACMKPKEMRLREKPFAHTPEGVAGVDEVMVQRFQTMLDLGFEYGISFIVGLITGWMSGRLYLPEALLGYNPITDSRSIKWQIKFVRYMVKRFRDHSAIAAWDLGNECNCMGDVACSEDAYLWQSAITDAIRSQDTTRPVVSGMHGIEPNDNWNFRDQGEILDVVCTHPYTIYTPYCDSDPLNEMKTILHSAAQTVYYRGLSGKPAFIEEIGSLGPWIASDDVVAEFYNTVMFSAWAHNCLGSMWWCGFDQCHLENTPYDWSGNERYLGFFRNDMTPKPIVNSVEKFTDVYQKVGRLPNRIVDAVCIIANNPDPWQVAFGTFLVAKKAHMEIEYCHVDDEIPDAKAYLLPSLRSSVAVYKHQLDRILKKVENGAALYISVDDVLLCEPIDKYAGIQLCFRSEMSAPVFANICGERIPLQGRYKSAYREVGANVLLRDEDGAPVLVENKYGNGKVYFCTYPIESYTAGTPGCCSGDRKVGFEKIYSLMPDLYNGDKRIFADNPFVGITEHPESDIIKAVLINYTPKKQKVNLETDGLCLNEIIGDAEMIENSLILHGNDSVVLVFGKLTSLS